MSERSPSSNSSASRKTWLSSTRTTRIGSGIARSLFRGQEERGVRLAAGLGVGAPAGGGVAEPVEERVVRLAAGLDVELQAGMALANPFEERVEVGGVGPGQQGQHRARLGEQRVGHLARDLVEAVSGGDGLAGRDA